MIFRTATRQDLPAIIALLSDEDAVVDPRTVEVDAAYERAFAAVDADGRNEMVVLDEGDGTVVGCLQLTYIPGLGRHGQERALIEAVRVRADRRGAGLGRSLLTWAIDRARSRGCTLVQLTSNKRRAEAHRLYGSLGFAASHDGFKLPL
ncbi:GNAT family N-acetyltransferase [Streptomyces sp. NBC_00536]|uniref:GNAT family N-acetyltransferase n=1 Tax=Streptomyces sp. NBC_00536 TaxID=2975769 RepID=UPI002E811D2E|nr:GNAT family N-acetyltransferase [Streptomyces sp. NBC_00536]WUC82605.1 GNAT family N-acetyltransferase [Streptomyces sp. NBC_00536]